MKRIFPSNSAPALSQDMPLLKLGFCVNAVGEQELIDYGIAPELIWMRGRGMENLEYVLRCYRGRPGVLAVADDLRIFGDSRTDIFAKVRDLEILGIVVFDVVANDNNALSLVERALKAKSAQAGMKNHRTARRRGQRGGVAKGNAAAARRDARIEDKIAIRLCASRLTWEEKAEILDMPLSTIQRHY